MVGGRASVPNFEGVGAGIFLHADLLVAVNGSAIYRLGQNHLQHKQCECDEPGNRPRARAQMGRDR